MSEKQSYAKWFGNWDYLNESNFALLKAGFLLLIVVLFRFASAAKVRMYYAKVSGILSLFKKHWKKIV